MLAILNEFNARLEKPAMRETVLRLQTIPPKGGVSCRDSTSLDVATCRRLRSRLLPMRSAVSKLALRGLLPERTTPEIEKRNDSRTVSRVIITESGDQGLEA